MIDFDPFCENCDNENCIAFREFLTNFGLFLLGFCTIENSRKHVNCGAYCYYLSIEKNLYKSYLENKSKNV